MTHCKVLRCSGDAVATFDPYSVSEPFKVPVCAAHDEAVRSCQRWIMDGDFGVPVADGLPPQAGYFVRMGWRRPL